MVRLPRTGYSVHAPVEIETTLDQVVADLGLAPMPAEEKARIRSALSAVNGRGLDECAASPKLDPHSKLQVEDIIAALAAIARDLKTAEQALRGCENGLRQARDIEVAKNVREILAMNPEIGNIDKANEFLSDCNDRLSTISHACLVAAKGLKSIKGKAGRKPLDWHDDFTAILTSIAEQNGIRATITIDRESREAQGRFLDLAALFEGLLLPSMRSPSRTALAKRLSRSITRLPNRQGKKSERPRTKSPSR